MSHTNRREFFRHSIAAGAAAALPLAAQSAQVKRANDVIELGPAKIKVSRMAIGTGTFGGGRSSNQLRKLGPDGIAEMFYRAFDKGVFFWDSGDTYGTHAGIKVALQKLPREKVTVLTKTTSRTADGVKADLDRFLQEMGTDYIDIVLLHSRMSPKWDQLDKGPMDVLSEAKQQKKVRAVGISVHMVDAMKVAANSPWLEVVMTRVNQAGIRMDADNATVLPLIQAMKDAGKGVVAMKTLGEGQLKDRIDESLAYVLKLPSVDALTVGCESTAIFEDTFSRFEKASQLA